MEYGDPTDLVDRSSNIEIGSCWYQKGTDHLKVGLKIIINTLASKTYMIDLDAYELHLGYEKDFNIFINECYDRQSLIFKNIPICIS